MKTKIEQQKINSIKNPKYIIDPELNKYAKISLFPKKVKKAKAHLAKVGMPKEYYEQTDKNKEKNEN